MAKSGRICVGVGGWTFEPWRDNFYPKGLAQKRELEYASRHVTSIEVNGTFYRNQSAASFAKWRDETPDDFVFSLKAVRYATERKVLAEAGKWIEGFLGSGLAELGQKLGPISWQFPPSKRFEPEDFEAFLKLLPNAAKGVPLRHVLEVRHKSFMVEEYLDLARRYGMTTVFTDSPKYPSFADVTGDFVYARLMQSQASEPTGYTEKDLQAWAARAKAWAEGSEPDDLPKAGKSPAAKRGQPRDVFVYFINGAKERAPHAAQALLALLTK
jgi:uncharacterized protein YecE (DUF72 family)